MREILFRGKAFFDGAWVEGDLRHGGYFLNDNTVYIMRPVAGTLENIPVDPATVGQYTGLTDKNGKKIFEGDIIKIPDNYDEFGQAAGEVYEVYFSFGGFRLKPKYTIAKGYWLEDDRLVEIIGNIHDNPELLEQEADNGHS